jgi:tetratricopeptide (TPR) repeat protein
MRLGEYKEAIEKLEKAIEIKPDYMEAFLNLAISLNKLKRYDESIEKLEKVITLKPDCPDAYLN